MFSDHILAPTSNKIKNISIDPIAKGLIFDCDGTLVDSMPLHMDAWKEAVENIGAVYDHDLFYSNKGMKEKDIVDLYNSKHKTSLDVDLLVEAKHKIFRENISKIKRMDIVANIAMKYKNILPMAVVSGGTKENVFYELRVTGLGSLFKIILTADDSFAPKPAPDLFLEAARLLNVKPTYCQVFEDGDLGIQAAINAGMIVTDVRIYI
jgi:beta-phosphoglucomutase-like phosphatase (HAD superfamily)